MASALLVFFAMVCVSTHLVEGRPQNRWTIVDNTGGPCWWNGLQGQCVSAFRCLSAVFDVKNKDYPPEANVQSYHLMVNDYRRPTTPATSEESQKRRVVNVCGYDNKTPLICCTDCELVNDTRHYLFHKGLGISAKSGTNKARDRCLDYLYSQDYKCKNELPSYIFEKNLHKEKNCTVLEQRYPSISGGFGGSGGVDAKREQYPHMALLGYGNNIDSAVWWCGGSVISDRFILTAGHCISSPEVGPVKFIGLGILKRSDPREIWQRYLVKQIIPHPLYKPPSKYHDIALLKTDRIIAFNSAVLPACLHFDENIDESAVATGWGALGHKKVLADTLQAVSLIKYNESRCAKNYPPHRHLIFGYDNKTQMCYGDLTGSVIPTNTCEGDSGGPLQVMGHITCMYTILGVTSYGHQCGVVGVSGIYTRVNNYVSWIESIVWP